MGGTLSTRTNFRDVPLGRSLRLLRRIAASQQGMSPLSRVKARVDVYWLPLVFVRR